jgi:mannosyl-oligosaccharide alpha-1,2-mannosidase
MFICAWVGLLSYMPEIQAKDSDSFKNAYDKFHSRVPLSSFSNMDGLDVETQPLDRNTLLTAHGNNPSTHENNPSQLATRGNDPSQLTTRGNDPSQLTTRGSDPSAREDNPSHRTPMATSRATQSKDINDHRKATVKEMIRHAWDGYVKYAFGENEVKPITKKGHSAVVFGKTKVGATLVDSLDTLYIAGLYDEFNDAKRWVESQFSINEIDSYISFFEFNIRFIGGFLSAYALSGDKVN